MEEGIIYQNDNYKVVVGATDDGPMGYVVTNKETGIGEYSSRLLPQVLMAAYELNQNIDEFYNKISTSDLVVDKEVAH